MAFYLEADCLGKMNIFFRMFDLVGNLCQPHLPACLALCRRSCRHAIPFVSIQTKDIHAIITPFLCVHIITNQIWSARFFSRSACRKAVEKLICPFYIFLAHFVISSLQLSHRNLRSWISSLSQPQRIRVTHRIPIDIGVNDCPRRALAVSQSIFPRRINGLRAVYEVGFSWSMNFFLEAHFALRARARQMGFFSSG